MRSKEGQECGTQSVHGVWELLMDASASGLDTMMYGEPGDIWIFQVATLNRITNPEHVHSEAHAFTEWRLLQKPGLLALFSGARALGHQA